MIPKVSAAGDGRYWVLGGRWTDEGRHLPWPRVLGPFASAESARESARQLNALGEPQARYVVVTDLPEGESVQA